MDKPVGILPPGFESLAISAKTDTKEKSKLGQEAFLELMVTQLQNQDPLNPTESSDFLGQLAQFSTVNGITELQGSFSLLANSLQSNQALEASTMVGREVLVPGNAGTFTNGAVVKGAVSLTQSTGDLSLAIHDQAGQLVRRLSLGANAQGNVRFVWDGLNDAGQSAPEGIYQVSAEAQVDDQTVSMDTLIQARVESVSLQPGEAPRLNLTNLGSVSLDTVKEVL